MQIGEWMCNNEERIRIKRENNRWFEEGKCIKKCKWQIDLKKSRRENYLEDRNVKEIEIRY